MLPEDSPTIVCPECGYVNNFHDQKCHDCETILFTVPFYANTPFPVFAAVGAGLIMMVIMGTLLEWTKAEICIPGAVVPVFFVGVLVYRKLVAKSLRPDRR